MHTHTRAPEQTHTRTHTRPHTHARTHIHNLQLPAQPNLKSLDTAMHADLDCIGNSYSCVLAVGLKLIL